MRSLEFYNLVLPFCKKHNLSYEDIDKLFESYKEDFKNSMNYSAFEFFVNACNRCTNNSR